MKKICTIVGARPQFIKAAVVSKEIRKYFHEVIIHTGQHYDENMSKIFFDELNIPKPKYNLNISGGTHAQMTGNMVISIEKILLIEKPDLVLVYGDTNSTLSAAIAASKMMIPICHVEAGVRMNTLKNPEEINRVLTDHVSSILMCSTEQSVINLKKENIVSDVYLTGDPMYDAYVNNSKLSKLSIGSKIKCLNDEEIVISENFYYLTCHRQENTLNDINLTEIFKAMEELNYDVIYPVHPRNRERAMRIIDKFQFKNIKLINPVGYLDSLFFINNGNKIITDSGGVQREAFFAKKPCLTVLDDVCWPELMISNYNQLAKPLKKDILEKLSVKVNFDTAYNPFGDGSASEKIVEILNSKFV